MIGLPNKHTAKQQRLHHVHTMQLYMISGFVEAQPLKLEFFNNSFFFHLHYFIYIIKFLAHSKTKFHGQRRGLHQIPRATPGTSASLII